MKSLLTMQGFLGSTVRLLWLTTIPVLTSLSQCQASVKQLTQAVSGSSRNPITTYAGVIPWCVYAEELVSTSVSALGTFINIYHTKASSKYNYNTDYDNIESYILGTYVYYFYCQIIPAYLY